MMQKELAKTVSLVIATTVAVSGVWGFFLVRELSVRDERIKLLQDSQGQGSISESLRNIDRNVAKLSLATSVDPIDGRVSLGNGVSGPSKVTEILIEVEGLVQRRQFDLVLRQKSFSACEVSTIC